MARDYRPAYESFRASAMLRFLWDTLRAGSNLEKMALANRARDYLALAGNPARFALHRELQELLQRAASEWPDHDYGEGYHYQGWSRLGITGMRDTDARLASTGLAEHVRDRRVLDIGCNAGFLGLALAATAREVVGFDLNPHLVAIARVAQEHLGVTNTRFEVSAFEDLPVDEPFGAVLSLANHSTYDGNTRFEIAEYLDRCRAHLEPGGLLLFESHPPAWEGDRLAGVLELLAERFEVLEERVLDAGTHLDRGRTFVVARDPRRGLRPGDEAG